MEMTKTLTAWWNSISSDTRSSLSSFPSVKLSETRYVIDSNFLSVLKSSTKQFSSWRKAENCKHKGETHVAKNRVVHGIEAKRQRKEKSMDTKLFIDIGFMLLSFEWAFSIFSYCATQSCHRRTPDHLDNFGNRFRTYCTLLGPKNDYSRTILKHFWHSQKKKNRMMSYPFFKWNPLDCHHVECT